MSSGDVNLQDEDGDDDRYDPVREGAQALHREPRCTLGAVFGSHHTGLLLLHLDRDLADPARELGGGF